MTAHPSLPRRTLTIALILVAGLVASGVPTSGASVAARDTMAPVGVWSGSASEPDDTAIIVILPGNPGEQRGYYYIGNWEDGRPAMTPDGTVAYTDDGQMSLTGSFIFADTGEVIDAYLSHGWSYDATNDTITTGYPQPAIRRCAGANSTIVGTSGDDLLVGTPGPDVIDGLSGNDVIKGKGGMDILCGQGGRDTLIGGGDIDVLVGGGKKDRLKGGPGWDLLLGEGGPDILKGGGGDDFIFGGPGRDLADGGGGSDTCSAETEVSC